MKREVITCDVCGKERKSLEERWFKVGLSMMADGSSIVQFICAAFQYSGNAKDACGEVCAMRLFDRWLSHGNLEEGEPRPVKARSA